MIAEVDVLPIDDYVGLESLVAVNEKDPENPAGVAVRKPHVLVVFGRCYSAKVGGTIVPSIAIYVVYLQAIRDRPVMQLPNESVGAELIAADPYHFVAVSVRRARSLSSVLSVPEIKQFGVVDLMCLPELPVHSAVGRIVTEQRNNVGAACFHLRLRSGKSARKKAQSKPGFSLFTYKPAGRMWRRAAIG